MNCKGLKNVNIVTPNGVMKSDISIQDGKLASLTNKIDHGVHFNEEVYVVPGFIDEHIHGVNNSDVMDGEIDHLLNISMSITHEGTTSYLPTTMTQSKSHITQSLQTIDNYIKHYNVQGAEVLGVHLEGPFINSKACGAQPKEFITNPTIDTFKHYQEASGHAIKLVTIAPEIEGGQDLIHYCHKQGIVASIGHTRASYTDVLQAIKNGATSVTHCFNAMTGLHHREIGVVGATLIHDELDAEVIADGIHVSEQALVLLYKNKGKNKITLITDSMRAKGLEDGIYELGGQAVHVKNGQARLADGTLAGSVLTMIEAFRNSMRYFNLSLEDAVLLSSTNPAKKLGVFNRKGSIEVGKDADLVVLDENYQVIMTICRGKIAYERGVTKWK